MQFFFMQPLCNNKWIVNWNLTIFVSELLLLCSIIFCARF